MSSFFAVEWQTALTSTTNIVKTEPSINNLNSGVADVSNDPNKRVDDKLDLRRVEEASIVEKLGHQRVEEDGVVEKLGHRRVDEDGVVTFKKTPTTELETGIQLGLEFYISKVSNKPAKDLLYQASCLWRT